MVRQDIELTTRGATPEASDGCACCGPRTADSTTGTGAARRSSAQYQVAGLTCGGCVNTLTKQLTSIDGVEAVDIALVSDGASTVTVSSSAPLSRPVVAAAIADAGYTVVPTE